MITGNRFCDLCVAVILVALCYGMTYLSNGAVMRGLAHIAEVMDL